ncbi:hypothetical protein AB4254_11545 [Vibrio breoganii]
MSHRKINNVGYKKLFPMSLFEDATFCHYCGRKANPETQLEWDHVPALNVTIPDIADCEHIRKTLIRSCRECNALASDHPHLDYLSRHLWLKGALIRRYKRLLLAFDGTEIDTSGLDPLLTATVNNNEFKYDETMHRIGFGIRDVSEIDSPILNLRNKAKIKLREALTAFMFGIPTEDDDDKPTDDIIRLDSDGENQLGLPPYSYPEFLDFLASEIESGQVINDDKSYFQWRKQFPSRAVQLDLPAISPAKFFGKEWGSIISAANSLVTDNELDEEPDYQPPRQSHSEHHSTDKLTKPKVNQLTLRDKSRKLYALHGKNHHIKKIRHNFVYYRCARHGEQVESLEAMLSGHSCCKE